MQKPPKKLIGRKEKISLPGLSLFNVWAKVDTGAYTSSLHAEGIRLEQESGKTVLVLKALLPGHKKYTGIELKFEQFREKMVKNSFGQSELRYLVELEMELAGERFMAEFTLTDRSKMKNSILLGRKIVRNRFCVDVSQVNLSRHYKK